ncbi:PRAME family member 5 [Cricetulus griseus]|uniref:PRAME family member 5 n=1 Tax=Cricetulus griseus TaxID=10029 RepID=A0A9J7HF10_CRIGR|nr:PRAME family member 5 [Cricetulus griseus]XP_035309721.1 PRAME family member 5 [Cricetulus griseus]
MSIYNPPSLQHLAMQNLLWNEASTISTLEYLPPHLFPPVFKEAFTGRHMQLLKAMVAAWPFSYLPVGALMETPNVELLQAVLGGVDILQAQKVRPRWKLRVLDLRNVNQDFLNVWASRKSWYYCSTEHESEKKDNEMRPDVKVVTDLSLRCHLKEHQTCLLQWAQQRKDSVQLSCVKMEICDFPAEIIKEFLDIFPPEELHLTTNSVLPLLHHIASHLGHMTKLRKCHLSHIFVHGYCDVNAWSVTEDVCAIQFLSQLFKLTSVEHFSMDTFYFFSDVMQLLFSSLKTPLESLSITDSLGPVNLNLLSQCQGLCQLRHLSLSNSMFSLSGDIHLRVLLENTAHTLQTLELVNCRMRDSELRVLLPALSQCSQLITVNFYDNNFSIAALKKLVQGMACLSNLTGEFYPAPLECYDPLGYVLVEEFAQVCLELQDIFFAKRQPKKIAFATRICPKCRRRCVYNMETRLCQCWQ